MADVTADHLDQAVQIALGTLRTAPADSWQVRAGELDWDCWETAAVDLRPGLSPMVCA